MRINPVPGRVVHYWPRPSDPALNCHYDGEGRPVQPMAATVAYVVDPNHVNLVVIDHMGCPVPKLNVQLVQEDDAYVAEEHRCEWMPYQLGQAAKTEAAEAKVASAAPQADAASVENLAAAGAPIAV